MAAGDLFREKLGGGEPGDIFRSQLGGKKERTTLDISDLDNLASFAKSKGLKVKDPNKPSFFRRTIDLLSRGNYMAANLVKDMVDGGEFKPASSAWRGLKGQDKTTFSDVLGTVGVQNKILKGGLGFILDVALDPTTYFGGAIVKTAFRGSKMALTPAGKVVRKAAPDFANHMIDAGKSINDAFGSAFKFGFKTTPGLSDEVARGLNRIGMAKEDVVNKYIDAFAPLNRKQQKEFAETLIANRKKIKALETPRVKELTAAGKTLDQAIGIARKEAQNKFKPIFKDDLQKEVFDGLKDDIDNLAKNAGLDDAFKIEAYYPIMDVDRMNKASRISGVFDKTKEGYKKEFKDIVKDPSILKKPIEAFSRVEADVMRNKLSKEILDTSINNYGVSIDEFAKLDDVAKAGFREVKDKTLGGKTIGYLKERDSKFINDYLFPEFKAIDLMAKASGYDKLTRFFKTAVTSWFPAFHARNFVSGVAQSYEVFGRQAFNPQNYNTALGVLKKGNKMPLKFKNWSGTAQELRAGIRETFEGSSRYIADLGSHIDDIGNNKFRIRKMKDPGRKLGNWIETYHKTVGTIIGLRQGKSLNEALKLAENAAFDYRKITKFESKIMRRLIPFYTFMRKNAGLQLSTLKNHPERIINQSKMANGLSEMLGGKVTQEDLQGLPDWVLNGLGFKLEGDKYVSQFGLPLEEFIETANDPARKALTSLNPIIKFPLEGRIGYDFFREKNIVDIDTVAPATGAKLWEIQANGNMPQWMEETLNLKRHKYDGKWRYTASPKTLHLLRNLPTSRMQGTFEKMFDKDMDAVNKWTSFMSGIKVYDIDKDQQKFFREKDLRTDIERQLMNIGEGEQFKTFYINK